MFLLLSVTFFSPLLLLQSGAEASTIGPLIKHLSSLLKWTMPSPKPPQTDENAVRFEKGYLVETVVERGNKLGVEPYSIRVSPEGELFAVDSVNSNIVRITPPLSQYSRARLVAGSFQGYSGHVDGKPADARFHHPKGVTVDDKGNVYVADTSNLAIRKIGETGVTTLAGGKSNVAGYVDGPSEDAKFSSDFDVVYIGHSCSLLVVDRGNAALREIPLHREDCRQQDGTNSSTDFIMVIVAVLVGYVSSVLQHGFGHSSSTTVCKQVSESEFQEPPAVQKPILPVETLEDPIARWPSPGRLVADLLQLAFESVINTFLQFIPQSLRSMISKKGLTPIKDNLIMPEDDPIKETLIMPEDNPIKDTLIKPEDKPELPFVQRQRSPPLDETPYAPNTSYGYTQQKLQRSKLATSKDPSFSGKHRSSKQQESAESPGSDKTTRCSQLDSKRQTDWTGPPHKDKSGAVVFSNVGAARKPVEIKAVNHDDPEFDRYNSTSDFGKDDRFHS
ncbi:NHL repeat [Cinnamomum micranthum f. kanehirae]|uniref:NHL repeat n=1 Tax=Cinnamomum micranthum f. kanehirae TaxID=337451 RepID=A0A443PZU4_9MAGN|nr:NHL repeat [Cinnamomum micranthum f. kanehirae]